MAFRHSTDLVHLWRIFRKSGRGTLGTGLSGGLSPDKATAMRNARAYGASPQQLHKLSEWYDGHYPSEMGDEIRPVYEVLGTRPYEDLMTAEVTGAAGATVFELNPWPWETFIGSTDPAAALINLVYVHALQVSHNDAANRVTWPAIFEPGALFDIALRQHVTIAAGEAVAMDGGFYLPRPFTVRGHVVALGGAAQGTLRVAMVPLISGAYLPTR